MSERTDSGKLKDIVDRTLQIQPKKDEVLQILKCVYDNACGSSKKEKDKIILVTGNLKGRLVKAGYPDGSVYKECTIKFC